MRLLFSSPKLLPESLHFPYLSKSIPFLISHIRKQASIKRKERKEKETK